MIFCENSTRGVFFCDFRWRTNPARPSPLPSLHPLGPDQPVFFFFSLEFKSLADTKILLAFNIFNNLLFIWYFGKCIPQIMPLHLPFPICTYLTWFILQSIDALKAGFPLLTLLYSPNELLCFIYSRRQLSPPLHFLLTGIQIICVTNTVLVFPALVPFNMFALQPAINQFLPTLKNLLF